MGRNWTSLDSLGESPHLQTPNSVTSAESPLPCKVTQAQIPGLSSRRLWARGSWLSPPHHRNWTNPGDVENESGCHSDHTYTPVEGGGTMKTLLNCSRCVLTLPAIGFLFASECLLDPTGSPNVAENGHSFLSPLHNNIWHLHWVFILGTILNFICTKLS